MGLSVSQLVHTPAHLTQNQVILCRKKASACHILLGLELTRVRGDCYPRWRARGSVWSSFVAVECRTFGDV